MRECNIYNTNMRYESNAALMRENQDLISCLIKDLSFYTIVSETRKENQSGDLQTTAAIL